MENDLDIFQIIKNIIECMADDEYGEGVVQLIAFLVCLVLQGLPQYSKDIDS